MRRANRSSIADSSLVLWIAVSMGADACVTGGEAVLVASFAGSWLHKCQRIHVMDQPACLHCAEIIGEKTTKGYEDIQAAVLVQWHLPFYLFRFAFDEIRSSSSSAHHLDSGLLELE
jgi:hypothetical protein